MAGPLLAGAIEAYNPSFAVHHHDKEVLCGVVENRRDEILLLAYGLLTLFELADVNEGNENAGDGALPGPVRAQADGIPLATISLYFALRKTSGSRKKLVT